MARFSPPVDESNLLHSVVGRFCNKDPPDEGQWVLAVRFLCGVPCARSMKNDGIAVETEDPQSMALARQEEMVEKPPL